MAEKHIRWCTSFPKGRLCAAAAAVGGCLQLERLLWVAPVPLDLIQAVRLWHSHIVSALGLLVQMAVPSGSVIVGCSTSCILTFHGCLVLQSD